jgi:hypothetical protein
MGSARPIEVFFLKILLATQFANLLINVESPSILESSDPNPHLVSLVLQTAHLLLGLDELIPAPRIFRVNTLQVLLQLRDLLTILSKQGLLVQVVSLDDRCDLLQIDTQFVTVRENL